MPKKNKPISILRGVSTVKKFHIILLIAILTSLIAVGPVSAEQAEGRYVILFEEQAIPDGFAEMVEAAGGRLARSFPQVGVAIAVSSDAGFVEAMSAFELV